MLKPKTKDQRLKTKDQRLKTSQGQVMISLLFVVSIILFWITESTVKNLSSVALSNETTEGLILLNKAEGHAENGAIRYLRNPSYTGESLQEGNISCTITLTDIQNGKDIVSACQKDQRIKKAGINAVLNNGVYTFSKTTER